MKIIPQVERLQTIRGRLTLPENRRLEISSEGFEIFFGIIGFVPELENPMRPGERRWMGGRKTVLDPSMSDDDIIRAIFGLLLDFDEHETREAFLVDGIRVFNPHISIASLQDAQRIEASR